MPHSIIINAYNFLFIVFKPVLVCFTVLCRRSLIFQLNLIFDNTKILSTALLL